MPPGKSKEDTWKASDLEKSLRESKSDGKKHRDKERDKDRSDKDKDRKKEKRRDDEEKPRRHRDDDGKDRKHRDRDDDRKKERDREKEKPKSKHREEEDEEARRRRKKEERRQRDEGDERENRHRRHRDENGDDRENRHRRHDDNENNDRERRHRRHRDETNQDENYQETRHRKHREEDDSNDRESRHRRHRERDEYEGDKEKRRDKKRDEGDDKRHKDKERRHKDDDDKDRRHRKDRGDDDDRKHRDRGKDRDDEDEEERRRRHKEKKEKRRREEEEKKRQEEEAAKKAAASNDGDDYDYGDDDFEDYDDDFEDDDGDDSSDDKPKKKRGKNKKFNSEMDEIMQAMNEENDRLISESKRKNWTEEEEDAPRSSKRPTTAGSRTFINFVSAKQRVISNKAASKSRVRGNELLQMIELDTAVYNMFDLPPINEYDLYIRSYGRADTKQAYVQTNDDNLDRDIQTEEIEFRDKWTQHPPDLAACGGDEDEEEAKHIDPEKTAGDLVRMNKFLQKAALVMSVLLEEDFAEKLQSSTAISQQSKIIVSDAFTELTPPEFLKDRPVIASQFNSVQNQMLLTVYGPQPKAEEHAVKQGCVCVWNVNEPSMQQKLLMCESQPRCCCFSPTKSTLAFAGMHDGSVVVWDLREPSSMHRRHKIRGANYTLRYPTYNTAGVLQHENHHSAVVSVVPIVALGDSASASLSGMSDSGGEGLSFQLATLEQNSVVHLWVVAEINTPDPSGSEADLGLAPGGRVKLIKSSTIVPDNPLRDVRLRTVMRAQDLQLLPSNNSHFYMATDTGCVLHGVRYGGKAPPRAYRSEFDTAVQVTSIDFSPFTEPVFLAGCADGSLRLYHADSEVALISWPTSTEGAPIRCVRWCRSRPSVFFVLDARSILHIWDLCMDDSSPLKSETMASVRVTGLCLSNDHSATGLGLPGRRPQMFVSLANGTCEVHNISSKFSAMMPDEVDHFSAYLQGII